MMRDDIGRRGGMARAGRRPADGGRGGEGAWFKALGVSLLVLALIAGGAGLWVAWAVRSGLDELAAHQQRRHEMLEQNRELAERRDQLLARERIEEAAAKLGLFPPREGQIRYP